MGNWFISTRRTRRIVAHLIDAKTGHGNLARPLRGNVPRTNGVPGPRSTPIIEGDRVYIQSCNERIPLLELGRRRKIIWGASFEKDFGVAFAWAAKRVKAQLRDAAITVVA